MHLLAKRFPLELHMIVRISDIRKFTFDVSNKNGTAHRKSDISNTSGMLEVKSYVSGLKLKFISVERKCRGT